MKTNIIPKNLADFVYKINLGKSIEGVLVTPEKIVATDSYKLLEVTTATGAVENYVARLPKGVKTFESIKKPTTSDDNYHAGVEIYNKGAQYMGTVIAEPFPEYEHVFPTGEPVLEVSLSPEYLKSIADAFSDGERVTMKCYAGGKPLLFINKEGTKRALLMPQTK